MTEGKKQDRKRNRTQAIDRIIHGADRRGQVWVRL